MSTSVMIETLNSDGTKSPSGSGTNPLIDKPYATAASDWTYAGATGGIANTTTAVTVKAAVSAKVNYITGIDVSHDALGAVTELAIRDGAGGTVLWRKKLQTTANEGISVQFITPLRCAAVNTLLEVVTLTAVTGGVFVNVQGYTV